MIKEMENGDQPIKIDGVFEGLPYKGPLIYLKDDDPDDKRPVLVRELKVARFDTSKKDDLAQYQSVCQSIADGRAQLSMEKIEYVPESRNWIILMRWVELWYGPPKNI